MVNMNEDVEYDWSWLIRYLAVILLLVVLAASLGHMSLFDKTRLGRLTAAHLVQFIGYGAALVVAWMIGRKATIAVRKLGGKLLVFQHLILPAISLLMIALAYSVILLVLKPFLSASLMSVYNWFLIVAILACAGWLVMAILDKSAALTEMLTK